MDAKFWHSMHACMHPSIHPSTQRATDYLLVGMVSHRCNLVTSESTPTKFDLKEMHGQEI
jgi:hypothetical protein